MTTNEPTAHDELIATVTAPLIELLSNVDDADSLDVYELIASMHRLVPAPMFEHIALSFDMCPIHLNDLDSCADDDALDLDEPAARGPIPLTACRHLRLRD